MLIQIDPLLEPLRHSPLYQSKFKLEWAHTQFSLARDIYNKYLIENKHDVFEVFEDGFYRLMFRPLLVPKELPILIGSGIHALRSSLDTAVSIMIEGMTGKFEPVNFPFHEYKENLIDSFCEKEKFCANCKHRHRVKPYNEKIINYLPELAETIINKIFPWKEGNFELWALNKLDNYQKHKGIIKVMTKNHLNINALTVEGSSLQHCTFILQPGSEIEILGSRSPISCSLNAYDCPISMPADVPFGGQPLFPSLSALYKSTRNTVLFLQSEFSHHRALHL